MTRATSSTIDPWTLNTTRSHLFQPATGVSRGVIQERNGSSARPLWNHLGRKSSASSWHACFVRNRSVPRFWSRQQDLERLYRIHYVAPGDARATGLPGGSIDFFYSTSVMEHIPERDLVAILRECKWLASRDALLGLSIGTGTPASIATITRTKGFRTTILSGGCVDPLCGHYRYRLRHGALRATI